jgi:hypothetical protein
VVKNRRFRFAKSKINGQSIQIYLEAR